MQSIPVLIVGGGPVGLSMALALARQNIRSLVVEKHPGRTPHPRARGVSMRTMELFRQWGNIDELLKYEFPREAIRFIWSESLQGDEVTRVEMKGLENYTHGPIGVSFVTQDCVEEYLHHTLLKYQAAEIQFSKEMISFAENATGVTVKLLDRLNNKEELLHADYVIAADGAHSPIRKQLEIEMEGPDNLGRSCSVYCEFDISAWTQHRISAGFFFTDPKLLGRSLFTAYGKNRWIVGMHFKPENTKEDFTDDYCLSEIRRVLAMPDLAIKIINKSFWTMAAQVAKQYRHGRVILIGDAAHRLPPTGGLGMNTGVADAHNLAWKLAFVLNHQASDKLLDTYYAERMPIAKRNIEWSTENAKRIFDIFKAIQAGDYATLKIKLHEQQKNLNYEGLDLGFIYHSKAVLSENEQVISVLPDKYISTTLPGSRAPYVQLIKDNKAIATLDLFENKYVLLVGSAGSAWQAVAKQLAETMSLPIECYRVANDGDLSDPGDVWHAAYEITTSGAVLVRPDGHVAWRSKQMEGNAKEILSNVLQLIMQTYLLKTNRLGMRLITRDDIDCVFELESDSEVQKFRPDGARTYEQTAELISKCIAEYEQSNLPCFLLFNLATNEFIGRVGFFTWETGDIEIGYSIHKKFWGLGYATEAVTRLLEWAKKNVDSEYITAYSDAENIASQRVMEKSGMQYVKSTVENGVEGRYYRFNI